MKSDNLYHYSLCDDWLLTKSKYSKWDLFEEKKEFKHLYRAIKNILAFHWFSYLDVRDVKSRLNLTFDSSNVYFIHISLFRLLNTKKDIGNYRNLNKIKNVHNFKTFLIPIKSSFKRKSENFLINLKTWDKNCLTKNWRRNLNRSKKSLEDFEYKEINILLEIDSVYKIIIENSILKKYKYPYSKYFLKNIIKKSFNKIYAYGAYNNKNEMVAIRAFYKVGDKAIDFIAASLPIALKSYVTYQIAFSLIMKAKELNLNNYDLGGVDSTFNKGVYNFKKGLGGSLISNGETNIAISVKDYFPDFIIRFILRFLTNFL